MKDFLVNKKTKLLALLVVWTLCLGIILPVKSMAEEITDPTIQGTNSDTTLEVKKEELEQKQETESEQKQETDLKQDQATDKKSSAEEEVELEVEASDVEKTNQSSVKSESEEEKNQMVFRLNYSFINEETKSTQSISLSNQNQLPAEFKENWKNLKITVIDEKGNEYQSPNHYVSTTQQGGQPGQPDGEGAFRYGGTYKEGERLTIIIDTSNIPFGYHINKDHNNYTYGKDGDPTKFFVTYKKKSGNGMQLPINFGILNIKFYPKGGKWSNGTTEVVERTVKTDNTVDFPTPTKENLKLKGWYSTGGTLEEWLDVYKNQYPLEDAKFYAEYMQKEYAKRYWPETQLFDQDTFDELQPINSNIIDPSDPLANATFLLQAQWAADVTFDSKGGKKVEPIVVDEGEKAVAPAQPTKKYAEFLGWQKDGADYDFETPVTGHMTLTANWKDYVMPVPQDVTINQGDAFNPKDGIKNMDKLPEGTTVQTKEPVNTNQSGQKEVVLLVTYPNQDVKEVTITLHIKSKPVVIDNAPILKVKDATITAGENLDLNTLIVEASDIEDGNLMDQVVIEPGDFDHTKVGEYKITFTLTDSGLNKVTKTAKVTVQAKKHTITYKLAGGMLNGAEDTVSMVVDEGETIILPTPTRVNYSFSYWEGSKYYAGDSYTVTGDHTFLAVWKKIPASTQPTEPTEPIVPTQPTVTPPAGSTTTKQSPSSPSTTATKPSNSLPKTGDYSGNWYVLGSLLIVAGFFLTALRKRQYNQ